MIDDDDSIPTYLDDGIVRIPVEYRRIRNRDDRIAALTRHLFNRAKHPTHRARS